MSSQDESSISGLCYIRDYVYHPFPLHSIDVSARVLDLNAQVQITQSYRHGADTNHIFDNDDNQSVECVYVFPLDEYSAIVHFECTIDCKTSSGTIKSKAVAKHEYEQAISSNKQAALLEQHAENVFQCRVGNLMRSSTADIKLTYLTTLTRIGAQHQLTLPMIVAPKYTPAPNAERPGSGVDVPHTTDLPHHFTFECEMEMASTIIRVECLSHPEMIIQHAQADRQTLSSNKATASLKLADTCSLTRDLVLSIHRAKPFEPRCIVEYDSSLDCCSVSLSLDCPVVSLSDASQLQCEYVFLLDQSGSMEGESITALQQSINLLIKSLPSQCRFQIIGFGSDFRSVFSKGCVAYSDDSVKKALKYTSKLAADMGGTELLAPLKHALTSNRTEWPRCVFVITDGQVSNTGELVSSIALYRSNTRVFSIGIGSDVDRSLCRKLARAGAGEVEFVSLDRAGDMKSSVLRQLGRAMQPMITDLKVDWGALGKKSNDGHSSHSPVSCPEQPSAVFPGTRFGIYLLDCQLPTDVLSKLKSNLADHQPLLDSLAPFEHVVTITAHTNQSDKSNIVTMQVPVTSCHLTHGSVIGRLAARSLITELEQRHAETMFNPSDPAPYDKSIEALGMRFGLASRATSFVVVFEDNLQDVQDEQLSGSQQMFQRQLYQNSMPMRSLGAPMMMASCSQLIKEDESIVRLADLCDMGIVEQSCVIKKKKFSLLSLFGIRSKSKSDQAEIAESESSNSSSSTLSSDVFDQLIMAQNAGGSWDLNDTLIKVIQSIDPSIDAAHVNRKSIKSLIATHSSSIKSAEQVIMTLIVISVFHRYFAARSDDWQFIEGKAKSFIDQRCELAQQQVINQQITSFGL